MKKIVAFSLFAILMISFAPLTNALASPKTTNLAAPFSLTKTPTKVPTFSRTPTRTLGPTNTSECYAKQDYKKYDLPKVLFL